MSFSARRMSVRSRLVLGGLVALLILAASVSAGVGLGRVHHARASGNSVFMQWGTPGGAQYIAGDSAVKGYEHWIELNSISWAISNPVPPSTATGSGSGKPTMKDVTFTKNLDSASFRLTGDLFSGVFISDTVKIVFTRSTLTGPVRYMELDLTKVAVTGQSLSAQDSLPAETDTVAAGRIKLTYWPTNPDGSTGTPVTAGWDFTTNTAA